MPKPLFERRHYEALAEWFADAEKLCQQPDIHMPGMKCLEELFTGFLKADNPRFDRDRFEAKIKELTSE